jgi:hypothetical protein
MEMFISLFQGGTAALIDYVWHHTFTCLVPAFFIAGAISAFVSKEAVMKYFGPHANKFLSYSVASVSGAILAVCSCTVRPLFAGIYLRGAGIGPAIAFLYSGPAINVLAITYTARLLGVQIGFVRAVFSVVFSVVIGLIMAFIYRKEEKEKKAKAVSVAANGASEEKGTDFQRLVFLATLIAILLTLTSKFSLAFKLIGFSLELAFVLYIAFYWFDRYEIQAWLSETWGLMKAVFPVLLVGVFIAGVIKVILPPEWVGGLVGGNTLTGNFIASVFGALMYFATLTEVPIIKSLMALGMGKGPALALLLSGPALSLPSMLTLTKIMGVKKTGVYIFLVVFFSTFIGYSFGMLAT